MQRVKTSTAVAVLPADPAGGTPGFFANPNPGGGVPATVPNYEWYNNVQEELMSVIEDAGLGANGADRAQLLKAIQSMMTGGQCPLVKSGANVVLSPLNGNKIFINGVRKTIPAAGVSLAPAGLTAGALYYVYAYMDGPTMTLEAVVTGHATDATTGVEIKTGDATRTLVGMVRPIAGPAFADTSNQRFVRSWFNREKLTGTRFLQAVRSTSTSTPTETNSADRLEFLCWGSERLMARIDVSYSNSSSGGAVSNYTDIYLDGTTALATATGGSGTTSYASMNAPSIGLSPTEGYHYLSPFIYQTGGGTLSVLTYSGISLGG